MSAADLQAAGPAVHASVAAHVPLLVDPRVRVSQLVTALASAGLTLQHDPQRRALIVVPIRQEGQPIPATKS